MALFARRVIHRCLNEVAEFVSDATLRDWVKRLNRVRNDYVSTEWEVVLVWAFARFGKVQHEPPLGQSCVDLLFDSPDLNLHFAAEIAAISDQPLHDRNTIDRFQDELRKRVQKAEIHTGRFV